MIKVLHLITSVQLGGAEIIAFNLAEYCGINQSEVIESVVAELHHTNNNFAVEKKKQLAAKSIKTISLYNGAKKFSLLIAPLKLARYIKKTNPDIIHSHTDLPDFVLSITLRILPFLRAKVPKIVRTIHNTELWSSHAQMGKFTETAFKNDWIVGISNASMEAYKNLRTKNNLPQSIHQTIIYNGCKLPDRKEHPFKIDSSKINIAFCGRFELQKGIDVFIERIKEMKTLFNDKFLFHIIGSGTYYNELKLLSENNPNVLLYDAVVDIANKFYPFDFLILPSRFEGLCLVSLESSLAKTPVILAIAPGLTETVPADWPLQFHLENRNELFSILEKIATNQYDREALKEQAYTFVSQNFSHQKMIDNYSKLYANISATEK
ncbi:MAG: glycosyltransferase family 4 protein [Chitinophagaceae bacterium]